MSSSELVLASMRTHVVRNLAQSFKDVREGDQKLK